jgi:hypothetical protein
MRYTVATIFIDHYSGLGYVHLKKFSSGQEIVEAKQAFERYAAAHGVHIHHYHAGIGRFADSEFQQVVLQQGQRTLSFCRENAHFQNGVTEPGLYVLHAYTCSQNLANCHKTKFVALRIAHGK